MAGVNYFNLEEISSIQQDTKIIVIGTVISMFKEEKFLSFSISDSTATAQATYYQLKSEYSRMNLPRIGDTIQILGNCWTKPIANEKTKLFLKIRIDRWRVLNFDEEIQIQQRIIASRKQRFQKKMRTQVVVMRKKVPIKQKNFSQSQMLDIRSLIFSFMYIVFSSNKDINSYFFCSDMVKKHSLCKDYAKQNQIPDKSMEDAIKRGLGYLLANNVIELRQPQAGEIGLSNPDQYIIKKRYFERMIVDIEEFVYERKNSGATLQQVTKAMNQKFSKYLEEEYLFNFKFIQKILIDLINQNRIYKTSDKKLYPYNY